MDMYVHTYEHGYALTYDLVLSFVHIMYHVCMILLYQSHYFYNKTPLFINLYHMEKSIYHHIYYHIMLHQLTSSHSTPLFQF